MSSITAAASAAWPSYEVTENRLQALFEPKLVAVIGATERPGAPAGVAFRNLIEAGFGMNAVPVHPAAKTVFGIPAVSSLADYKGTIDCAIIGISADKVTQALADAAAAGARAAVVLASGFAETGADGRRLQQEFVETARRLNMAVCGPNCMGLSNIAKGIPLFSAESWKSAPKGRLAILSHSGSGVISLATSGRLGISQMVSAGNSAVCDMAEYLEYLAEDEATGAAALFMESIRDPRAFSRAMERMHQSGKPVVAMRVGRSASGAAASAAHTGSLVSSDDAFLEFFRQTGVIVADDMDELIEISNLMSTLRRRPAKPGVGLINVSGGEIAHACDIAESLGLGFAKLDPSTAENLRSILPGFATVSNPLDATGAVFADPTLYPRCLSALAADPGIGILAVVQDAPTGLSDEGASNYALIAQQVADFSAGNDIPTVFISNLSSGLHPTARAPLEQSGVPSLNGTRAALKAVLAATKLAMPRAPLSQKQPRPLLQWVERLKTGVPLSEYETKQFLAAHGIAVTREVIATSAEEAAREATAIGFPVVLKVSSWDLPHKTEVGGVVLNLRSAEEVQSAYHRIMASVSRHAPDAAVEGILVQEMAGDKVEAIVGLARHDPFGLAVVVGSGGVLVELLQDVALSLPPLDLSAARAQIGKTRLATLLAGYRGSARADEEALADLLVKVSDIAQAYEGLIAGLDLNPVAVMASGQGVRVLDALLFPAEAGQEEGE
ncbi:acetate--CoA ligase family protein [Paracoccus sp. SY]|uniref:acetate--CoA ligase family protein n=1 Tax=Paracoccus sp. SY TaxID=1330255 RepID=UPI00195FB018|nr:acetate--CoA ligase family protein [Paracoccus sp. SY]